MNKQELVCAMSKTNGLSHAVNAKALESFIGVSMKTLKKGDSIRLTNFGTFSVSKRAATKGRNPATGAAIKIPAYKQPKFKAGKGLKLVVNK